MRLRPAEMIHGLFGGKLCMGLADEERFLWFKERKRIRPGHQAYKYPPDMMM